MTTRSLRRKLLAGVARHTGSVFARNSDHRAAMMTPGTQRAAMTLVRASRGLIVLLLSTVLAAPAALAATIDVRGRTNQFDAYDTKTATRLEAPTSVFDRVDSLSGTGVPRRADYEATFRRANSNFVVLGVEAIANNTGSSVVDARAQVDNFRVTVDPGPALLNLADPGTGLVEALFGAWITFTLGADGQNDNARLDFDIQAETSAASDSISGTTRISNANHVESGAVLGIDRITSTDPGTGRINSQTSFPPVFPFFQNLVPVAVPIIFDPNAAGGLEVSIDIDLRASARATGFFAEFEPDGRPKPSAGAILNMVVGVGNANVLQTADGTPFEDLGISYSTDPVFNLVPEPATAWLLAPVLLGVARRRGRRAVA